MFSRILLLSFFLLPKLAFAQDGSDVERAKELANPLAKLTYVQLQNNFDQKVGPLEAGRRYNNTVISVLPFSLNEDWKVISRSMVPIVRQEDIFPGGGDQTGLGDTVESLFFTRSGISKGNVAWGLGPALLLPTATEPLLGRKKWGVGPSGVALKQSGHLTIGGVFFHVWSFAGDDDREDVSFTYLQPYITYITKGAWSFTLTTDSTYDWKSEELAAPVAFLVGKVFTIDGQSYQISGGPRYFVESPVSGPHNFGVRLNFILLFPQS